MSAFASTRIEVAHDNALVDGGLQHIFSAWPAFEIVRQEHVDAVDSGRPVQPDVLVRDCASGIRAAMQLRLDRVARTKVLIVAMPEQESEARTAVEAGVLGFVSIQCSADEIVQAAQAVAAGRRHLCSAATVRMADSLAQPSLTPREGDVLALVYRGFNNKAVARNLGISVGTVKSHMRGLMSKLGARCRTEALWIASQHGLIARSDVVATEPATPQTPAARHSVRPPPSRVDAAFRPIAPASVFHSAVV